MGNLENFVSIRFKMNSQVRRFSSLQEFFCYENSILENCYSSKDWEKDLNISIQKKLILNRLVETWDEFQQEYNYYLFSPNRKAAENFLHFVDTETRLHEAIKKSQHYGFTTERFIIDCSSELFDKSIILLPSI